MNGPFRTADLAKVASLVSQHASICEREFPLARIPAAGDFVLAIITGIEGAAYRPIGAMMVIDGQGRHWGNLSSGCLERDLVLQAGRVMAQGRSEVLRYGLGSPFADIELPCGGGLDITLIPNPDRLLLERASACLSRRQISRLVVNPEGLASEGQGLCLTILPQIRFVVLGKGPEAACFARIAQQAGYPTELYAGDPDTLREAGLGRLNGTGWPEGLDADERTAVAMFFHDHAHEPALLKRALGSAAFYIGAQGSLRAHRARCAELVSLGVSQSEIDRIASPFGLIPSARDPRTLAVSVLADVLAKAT